ncbi:hypothetical protein HYV43_05810 [Candidatus Micrarchaeota archaeon]|nr:hypothetical protein [Candidatus Micrarchaeota archaeon]
MLPRRAWMAEIPRLDELLSKTPKERTESEHHDLLDEVWGQLKEHPNTWQIVKRAMDRNQVALDKNRERVDEHVVSPGVLKALLEYDEVRHRKNFQTYFSESVYRRALSKTKNVRQLQRKPSVMRRFLENMDAGVIKPDPDGYGEYLELEIKAKELRTPEEQLRLNELSKKYYDQRVFHRFMDRLTKKADPVKFHMSREATREDYRHVARLLARVHPEALKDLLNLADEKAKQSQYYTPDDIKWALRQKDNDFLYGIFRHLGLKSSSRPGEPRQMSQRKRRKFIRRWAKLPKTHVLAHEEGNRGIFYGDVQVIRRVRAHEFAHAVAHLRKRYPAMEWLTNHNSQYAIEEMFRLEEGIKTAATPPGKYNDGIRIGNEAYHHGLEEVADSKGQTHRRWNPKKAMTYLLERFTTNKHGPMAPKVKEIRGQPHAGLFRKTA